jgi:hypothetical protein
MLGSDCHLLLLVSCLAYSSILMIEAICSSERRKKSYPYRDSNSYPSAVQPVAGRYTDCAIPAPKMSNHSHLNRPI